MSTHTHKPTTVSLISHTQHPRETIYLTWLQSRTTGNLPTLEQLLYRSPTDRGYLDTNRRLQDEIDETFEQCLQMKLPVLEVLDFVFVLENVPIALREQIVRHRVGHRFGGEVGADTVPDLVDSTFWAQTMRVINKGSFARDGDFYTPESLTAEVAGGEPMDPDKPYHAKHNPTKSEFYAQQMGWIQSAYNRLINAGVPVEDARNLLPLGMNQRLTWKMNASALTHVLSKRSCWIAQLGMWEPVIQGISEELRKLDEGFTTMTDPPCFNKQGEFTACPFGQENNNRIEGRDPYPPCPLYLHHHEDAVPPSRRHAWDTMPGMKSDPVAGKWRPLSDTGGVHRGRLTELTVRGERYAKLWGRDPRTGQHLDIEA